MGGFGGFIKSLLSHNGRVVLPRYVNGSIIFGSLTDILLGFFMGLISIDPLVYKIFSLAEPSFALSGLLGFCGVTALEAIANRFLGCPPPRANCKVIPILQVVK